MKQISSTTPMPRTFASAGLTRQILAFDLAPREIIERLARVHGNRKLIAALAEQKLIDEDVVLRRLAETVGLELVVPRCADCHPAICLLLPRNFSVLNRCLPLRESDGQIVVGLADPLDMELLKELEFKLQRRVTPVLVAEGDVLAMIDEIHGEHSSREIDFDRLEFMSGGESFIEVVAQKPEDANEDVTPETAPIIRVVNKILADAISHNASDIHFIPAGENLDVRFRIDGMMTPQLSIPKRLQSYITARVKLLAGMDITEKRRPQDGGFSIRTGGGRLTRDVRASAVPTPHGETIVLRLLHSSVDELSFEALGMGEEPMRQIAEILSQPDRITIVTGPTGSGKSTTLYAALNQVRRGTNNIITVEDPIEFKIPGITQIQVNPKLGLTFASGLRSVLRQDPDVILVGEIRDLETAEMAFQAAQTGHLVLSTLHTNDAPSAVTRLLDLGLESFILSSSLGAVVAQRLLRVLCDSCARPASAADLAKAGQLGVGNLSSLRTLVGCKECGFSGYRGRRGVFSVMRITPAIREVIRRQGGETEIAELARADGMRDLFSLGLELVVSGQTTFSELERVIGLRGVETPSVAELVAQTQQTAIQDSKDILLVDDEESVRTVMAMVFETAGYQVQQAVDALDALEKLKVSQPRAIVLDLMMPKMSGQEFMRRVYADDKLRDIPVLVLTASEQESNEIELLELGARDFVRKTSSPAVVVSRLKRLTNHG